MRIKFITMALLCISLFFPLNVFAAAPQTTEVHPFQKADIVPGELIVIMKPGSAMSGLNMPEQARASTKSHQGLKKLNAGVIHIPPGKENEYIAKLKQQVGVLTVEPNYVVNAALYPDDPAYPTNQYGPGLIQAETAWDTTTGSASVVIAIIDSGLDATHPEFAGRTVAGYDFVEDDTIPQDQCGHGTHVAGIAAATGNNTQGIAGVAWGVKIMPLRMLYLNPFGICTGSFADMADALIWAADNGAKIINISVGGPLPSTIMQDAVQYAYNHGVAIFAASGNSNGAVYYPAAYPEVMAVGSVNSGMARAATSNFGSALDLMAPGVNIYSTLPMTSGAYGTLSGTSMAAPHAAGAAALLASLSCFDTPDKIYRALMDSARDLGAGGWDQQYGYGLIQIADAMVMCPAVLPTTFAVEYDMVSSENCSPLVQYDWVDASSSPNATFSVANEGYRSVPLSTLPSPAFTFNFGGTNYTSTTLHDNGFISLGANKNTNPPSSPEGNYKYNFRLPGNSKPDNFIAPFWDDLTGGGAAIFVKTIGSAPSRQFVIEYSGIQRVGVTANLNFEVILFEGSNNIKMQYRALTGTGSDGSSATVGLEYGNIFTGFAGYEYAYNQPGALKDGFALLFIPYASGSPTLPSNAVCPQMEAITIETGIANACNTSPATFDVEIAGGELSKRSALKVQQVTTAPNLPSTFLDLYHYADINLNYSPPSTSLPMPAVDVCYEYTPQDLLAAGGHPENLFIAAHEKSTNQWQRLPTTVDTLNMRLTAQAPHFSYYTATTLNPAKAGESGRLGLPVTGSPVSREFLGLLITSTSVVFLLSGIWLRRKRRR
jgi:subtilisin family serine protease